MVHRLRDGPLQKKYSRKGKLNEKIHARQLALKNIHAMAKKKKSYKEFDNEKNFLRLENSPNPTPPPPPTQPHNFSNGPSLIASSCFDQEPKRCPIKTLWIVPLRQYHKAQVILVLNSSNEKNIV